MSWDGTDGLQRRILGLAAKRRAAPLIASQAALSSVQPEVRDLIRRMSRENPTRDAPRILSELLLLGHNGAKVTVAKYTSCELFWKGQ